VRKSQNKLKNLDEKIFEISQKVNSKVD